MYISSQSCNTHEVVRPPARRRAWHPAWWSTRDKQPCKGRLTVRRHARARQLNDTRRHGDHRDHVTLATSSAMIQYADKLSMPWNKPERVETQVTLVQWLARSQDWSWCLILPVDYWNFSQPVRRLARDSSASAHAYQPSSNPVTYAVVSLTSYTAVELETRARPLDSWRAWQRVWHNVH